MTQTCDGVHLPYSSTAECITQTSPHRKTIWQGVLTSSLYVQDAIGKLEWPDLLTWAEMDKAFSLIQPGTSPLGKRQGAEARKHQLLVMQHATTLLDLYELFMKQRADRYGGNPMPWPIDKTNEVSLLSQPHWASVLSRFVFNITGSIYTESRAKWMQCPCLPDMVWEPPRDPDSKSFVLPALVWYGCKAMGDPVVCCDWEALWCQEMSTCFSGCLYVLNLLEVNASSSAQG